VSSITSIISPYIAELHEKVVELENTKPKKAPKVPKVQRVNSLTIPVLLGDLQDTEESFEDKELEVMDYITTVACYYSFVVIRISIVSLVAGTLLYIILLCYNSLTSTTICYF